MFPLFGQMAHRFDVVAVRVANEGFVTRSVVLRPHTGLVAHLGACGHRSLAGAAKATWASRNPSPVNLGPSQKSGLGGTL